MPSVAENFVNSVQNAYSDFLTNISGFSDSSGQTQADILATINASINDLGDEIINAVADYNGIVAELCAERIHLVNPVG